MSTVITTVETLFELPEGATVQVDGGQNWVKTSEGFRCNTYTIPTSTLTGFVKRGAVTLVEDAPALPQVGQMYAWGQWSRTVLSDLGGAYWVMVAHDQHFHDVTRMNADAVTNDGDYTLVEVQPEWVAAEITTGSEMVRLRQRVEDLGRQVRAHTERWSESQQAGTAALEQYKRVLEADLHELLDGNEFDRDSLEALMETHGMRAREIEIEVTTEVTGYTYHEPDHSDIDVGDARITDVETARVDWSYTFTTMQSTAQHKACMCDAIDYTNVSERLNDECIPFEEIEFESYCSND